ncbi:hypothetical protein [Streptomyces sp. MP131-18]|uniref:hypothetical protein n=1 Tax=Streptomyces sp. MP131-18 TaxID=1857892 RepID=UPI00097BC4C8|nr:hypothetical protein [Streptomyces sp. MP131-18]ONK12393.1 hypothetical protein STBA_31350 [Streptomyces sp. MP131-18]
MHPDVHLAVEHYRARELRAAAAPRPALARRRVRAVGRRLGWALVETGLRLVHRSGPAPQCGAKTPIAS